MLGKERKKMNKRETLYLILVFKWFLDNKAVAATFLLLLGRIFLFLVKISFLFIPVIDFLSVVMLPVIFIGATFYLLNPLR